MNIRFESRTPGQRIIGGLVLLAGLILGATAIIILLVTVVGLLGAGGS